MSEEVTIQTNLLTPRNWLFCKDSKWRFLIPVYQRLFAWDNRQFRRLLDDLAAHWSSSKTQDQPYYLGIITAVKSDEQFILVDGQQRLTVIAILAAMLADNAEDRSCLSQIRDRLDYEARDNDREALKTIAVNGNQWLNSPVDSLRKNLEDALVDSESMRAFLLHINEHKDKWIALWEKMKDGLTLFVSQLPEEYEGNVQLQNEYFEKMNSSGKQLEPHEILKVKICQNEAEIDQWNAIEDFTKKYIIPTPKANGNAVCLLRAIGSGLIDLNLERRTTPRKTSLEKWRPSLIGFPMFLLHVLSLKKESGTHASPSDAHRLLESFNEWLSADGNHEGIVDIMQSYRQFVDSWIIHKEILSGVSKTDGDNFGGDDSQFKYWKTRSDEESVYVDCNENEELKRKLKQLQMTLYALEDENQPWIVDAFHQIKKCASNSRQLSELYNHLLRYLIGKSSFVSDDENSAESSGIYQVFRHSSWPDTYLRYHDEKTAAKRADFLCLDFFLWLLAYSPDGDALKRDVFSGSISLDAIKSFVPHANRSIEHFHPQNDSKSQHQNEWKDTKDIFGNLALISAGRNTEYSNMSVGGKSERIEKLVEAKALESIKLYLMKEKCNGRDADWTPNKAREHAVEMAKVIVWGLRKELESRSE